MTLTDQDRRDRIDATAGILTDLGLPTLATRLRDVIDELLPQPAPATAPAWSPVVGGWAEHSEHGRVLVLDFIDEDRIPQYRIYRRGGCIVEWVAPTSLSAPRPRVWDRASDVPAHVVVTDRYGLPWPGAGFDADDTEMGPFTEVIGDVL